MILKSHRILLFFLPLFSLVVTACNSTPFGGIAIPSMTAVQPKLDQNSAAVQEELRSLQIINPTPYEIHPGDTISLSVYNQPALTSTFLVAPDGTASLPLIGILKLSDLNLEDATDLIESRLSIYLKAPIVTLSPMSVSGYCFTVAGCVAKPGNYTVSIGQTRLRDAIALFGGFPSGILNGDTVELADLDNAFIQRNGKKLPVDFRKLVREGDDLQNIPLLNGDYIYVPSTMTGSVIFLGEVGSNSNVAFLEGMSLLQGFGYVGGLKPGSYDRYIRVIRGGMENTVVYTVDVDKILNGKMKDFKLEANDIIYVPQDDLTKWNQLIRKILPTMQFINFLAGPFGSSFLGFFEL